MKKKDSKHIDMERYLNDFQYRKELLNKGKKPKANHKNDPRLQPVITWRHYFYLTISIILILMAGGFYFYQYLVEGLPSIEELENPRTDMASFVLSRDGEVLDKYFTENRTYIRYQDISENVIDALIATEDHRFYAHWGIDLYRTLAIPYHFIKGNPQGGSTISQQLARNLYRSIGREVSIPRKLREMITAIQIEQNYTKKEIIEMYLNTVEFSNSSFGIETASHTHFNKPASDLSVAEAATLIGTLQAVSALNPRTRTERSMRRRNVVLAQMAKHGFITKMEYEAYRNSPIKLDYNPPFRAGRESRYFGEFVRLQIQDWVKNNGYQLYSDGLIIHTTIDSRMQRHAENALKAQLKQHQRSFEQEWTSRGSREYMDKFWKQYPRMLNSFLSETERFYSYTRQGDKERDEIFDLLRSDEAFVDSVKRARTRLEAGFVAIDPANGNILAWVGGSDYASIQRDNVHQLKRQTGSTFKPFVYAVAIDNGYRPFHRFSKYPVNFFDASGQHRWSPRDPVIPSGSEMMTLREGLGRSLNNVTVRLLPELAGAPGTNRLEDLEPAGRKIADFAKRMGINKTPLTPHPSIALGTAESSLLELASAYTTFANMGVHIEPWAITRIEDSDGNILKEFQSERQAEVISPETAYIMIDMMRGVIRGGEGWYGTGNRMNWMFNIDQDMAGKTGTTQNSADNWFVGLMPHIVAASWVGGEDRRVRFPVGTQVGQGARTALPIVGQFFQNCINDTELEWSREAFEQPPGFIMEQPPDEDKETPERPGRISW